MQVVKPMPTFQEHSFKMPPVYKTFHMRQRFQPMNYITHSAPGRGVAQLLSRETRRHDLLTLWAPTRGRVSFMREIGSEATSKSGLSVRLSLIAGVIEIKGGREEGEDLQSEEEEGNQTLPPRQKKYKTRSDILDPPPRGRGLCFSLFKFKCPSQFSSHNLFVSSRCV